MSARLCKFGCGRPARRDRRWHQCPACNRARHRNGPCPECDGPRYGPDRWCPRCGPYKPPRPARPDEVLIVLVHPDGREREVLRRVGEPIPGAWRHTRKVTKDDLAAGVLVLDVSGRSWASARTGYYAPPPRPPKPPRGPWGNGTPRVFLEHDGRRMSITEWSRELGIARATLSKRIKRGQPAAVALAPRDQRSRLAPTCHHASNTTRSA